MTALEAALVDYPAVRRSLGYKLEPGSELLADFVAYVDQAGAVHVTIDLAVAWGMQPVNRSLAGGLSASVSHAASPAISTRSTLNAKSRRPGCSLPERRAPLPTCTPKQRWHS
jgi:hypothetical protein